jgi:hyperosmotically inducible protein
MKSSRLVSISALLLAISISLACNQQSKAPDVTDNVRQALDQAGLKDVTVSEDRDKGVVTLSGTVPSDHDKTQAESIARSVAGTQVVANEIGVRPPGDESTAKKVGSDLDKAIDKNVDAVLVQHKLNHDVSYDVNNGTVKLKGTVASEARRASVERLVSRVPNVKQVVNELEVKDQKATSTARNQ